MKKFLTLLTIALSLVLINHSCKPKEEEPGSIYGVVTDKATGEPVKNANVQLRPTGETTLTGNDGRYEFLDVKNGEYSISVSKTGYTNLVDDYVIIVDGPKEMRRDVQIEKLPAALRVVDDSGNDINELDFGSSNDDLSRMFSIFNDGVNTLNYSIVKTAAWITSISSESGTLQAGATMPIVVVIDRDKMSVGDNKTTLHITSNDGSKQMTIKAEKMSDVSTLDATNVTHDNAILKACINRDVVYSERGFYYGSDINNLSKVVVDGGGMGNYTYQLKNLEGGNKYYYKAYIVKNSSFIAVQNENIIAWKHNKYLSRKLQLNAPRIFMDKLEYKCLWNDVEFIKVPRNFPSTQICSECGERNYNMSGLRNLGIRDWECPHCKTHHNRDINAAKNILNKGLEIVGTTVQ